MHRSPFGAIGLASLSVITQLPRTLLVLLLSGGVLAASTASAFAQTSDPSSNPADISSRQAPGAESGRNLDPGLGLGAPPAAPILPEQLTLNSSDRLAKRQLVIRLDQRRVYVREGDTLLVSYPVAVGRDGWETPKGEFKVFQMVKDPSWQHPWSGAVVPPGPDNPLGRRWIGFWSDGVNAIGFHGTPDESLVGKAVSHGCIRMKNQDVEHLFAMVGKGTTVVVE